jgi:DNA segregation ATPase FtsK/SpoIIIE-like protein
VVNLSDDIALAIALSGSIEASDSGKLAIGIEVPIKEFAVVKLAQISTEQ